MGCRPGSAMLILNTTLKLPFEHDVYCCFVPALVSVSCCTWWVQPQLYADNLKCVSGDPGVLWRVSRDPGVLWRVSGDPDLLLRAARFTLVMCGWLVRSLLPANASF